MLPSYAFSPQPLIRLVTLVLYVRHQHFPLCSITVLVLQTPAFGQSEVCASVEKCNQLMDKVKTRIADLSQTSLYLKAVGRQFRRMNANTPMDLAWRAPSRLVWGNTYLKEGGIQPVTHQEAENYCASIDARLPAAEEFMDLKIAMGGDHKTIKEAGDYRTQILPDFGGPLVFWTSTTKTLKDGTREIVSGRFSL